MTFLQRSAECQLRNQPKYSIFRNTSYALKGLNDLIRTESSFRLELLTAAVLFPVIIFIDTTSVHKALMFMSLMGMLIAEAVNSAIERTVDLVTLEHHHMAGRAKDAGSAIVFLSIVMFALTWTIILTDIL